MNPREKMVFIDFDGVFAETFELAFMLRKELEPDLDAQKFRNMFRGNILDHKPAALTAAKLEEQARAYKSYLMRMPLYPGFEEAVGEISRRALVAILSSSPSSTVWSYLSEHGLIRHLSAISGGDVSTRKSAKISELLKRWGISALRSALITDTMGDILEGKEAGVKTVAVTWGYHSRSTLEEALPDMIIDDPGLLDSALSILLI